jgi:hypothetical protein
VSYHPVGPPMSGPSGPLPMMFPPCPPWTAWYGPWTPSLMHFQSGWSGPAWGFDNGGYYPGDAQYGGFNQYRERVLLRFLDVVMTRKGRGVNVRPTMERNKMCR